MWRLVSPEYLVFFLEGGAFSQQPSEVSGFLSVPWLVVQLQKEHRR